MTEDKKLTLKQAKWLDVYIQTGNATEAAMQAYDCKDRESASALGAENIGKLKVADLMEEMGLTASKLVQKHAEGLESMKVNNSPTEGDRDVPDYPTRYKYLELAYKVKGFMKESTTTNIQVNNGNTIVFADFNETNSK